MVTDSIIRRFWPKVDVRSQDECWEWQASRHPGGYGQMGAGKKGEGVVRAHRVSYEIHHGPIPKGMMVCHCCDNPPCCNPHHLYLGTPADNMRDRKVRGRATGGRPKGTVPNGTASPNAKLTEEQVREILTCTGSVRQLAKHIGISDSHASRIRSGKQWKHLHGEERTSGRGP